jgi:hypothetical protein
MDGLERARRFPIKAVLPGCPIAPAPLPPVFKAGFSAYIIPQFVRICKKNGASREKPFLQNPPAA